MFTEKEFFSYVFDFYGAGGIYDMNVTISDIMAAYIRARYDMPYYEFEFDSVDRELIRDVLIDNFGYKFPEVL